MSKHVALSLLAATTLSLSVLGGVAHAGIEDTPTDDGGGGAGDGTGGTAPATTAISKHGSWEPSWGTTNWGASLYASGSVSAAPAASYTDRDRAAGSATLMAHARIAGSRYRLVNVRANASVENGRKAEVHASAALGGAAFWNYDQTTTLRSNVATLISDGWDKTLFDRSVGIWVGPVPVTFTAKVSGRLGAGLTGYINVTRLAATFTPTARASLYASAAIGGEYCVLGVCAGASAGVAANLNLFSVSTPTVLDVALTPVNNGAGLKVFYNLRSDFTVSSLDGDLSAFAEAHVAGVSYDWSTELLSWPGYSASAPIVSYAGAGCLVGNCETKVVVGGMTR